MTVFADVGTSQLAELVKQVQAGNEVLLTQDNLTVAKLVPAPVTDLAGGTDFQIRSFKGHRALTPLISQAELAEEMFQQP